MKGNMTMRNKLIQALLALGSVVLGNAVLTAVVRGENGQNIDLSTVPSRNTVQLTIYNSEDLTLVRETRKVTFKLGSNPLQFSWANTLIDPTSVELRFLTRPRQADRGSTRPFPTTSRRCFTGTYRAKWTARRRSKSPTSPAALVGRPITSASPTRTNRT